MDIQFYYAGENARQTYEYAAPVLTAAAKVMSQRSPRFDWDRATNTLKVLVVTAADIDPQGDYKKHDWTIIPGCGTNTDKAAIDIASYVDTSSRKFYSILRSSVKAGFMPEDLFQQTVLNSPAGITSLSGIVAVTAMPQTAGVINLVRELPELGRNYIVLNMPDEPPSVEKTVQEISGLEMKYLKNITGTANDWSMATLGHEVVGHGLHGHVVPDAQKFGCSLLDYELSDITVRHEGLSDIAMAETVKVAKEMGKMSNDDILPSWESVRVLGSFFKNHNAFSVKVSAEIDAHTTTLLFDPSKPESAPAFNQVAGKGVSALPVLINTYVDFIAGYAFAYNKNQALKNTKWKSSTFYERKLFGKLEGDIMSPDLLIEYGGHARFGKEADEYDGRIVANPAYHVAAMKHLQKTGGFAAIRAAIAPALHQAFDDLIADYFKAIERHGSSLLASPEVDRQFNAAFKGLPLGYQTLTGILFNQPVLGMKAVDLTLYRSERALDESVPAFLRKGIK